MSTCLMDAFKESSLASFFVSQKTMVLPWLPLYTWMTSPNTAARCDQWHAIARCCKRPYRKTKEKIYYDATRVDNGIQGKSTSKTFLMEISNLISKSMLRVNHHTLHASSCLAHKSLPQRLLQLSVFSCQSNRYACTPVSCISWPLHTPMEGRWPKTEESAGWCQRLERRHRNGFYKFTSLKKNNKKTTQSYDTQTKILTYTWSLGTRKKYIHDWKPRFTFLIGRT